MYHWDTGLYVAEYVTATWASLTRSGICHTFQNNHYRTYEFMGIRPRQDPPPAPQEEGAVVARPNTHDAQY